ncbi:MAG: Asp23/Gls24 family envelope stress response protein [Candidatus Omnitrophota bacterium]|nr:MAG: Asp23/Gls24 family envelope stress response protein [Candidatus Omnitrophota bacterium]
MANKAKKTDLGTLKINNQVIAAIAKNAALDVKGVIGIKSNPMAMLLDVFNKGYRSRGIRLEITDNEVKVKLTISVAYGVNIPDVAAMVQESVRSAIEEMAGLSVSEVGINVANIHSEKTGAKKGGKDAKF